MEARTTATPAQGGWKLTGRGLVGLICSLALLAGCGGGSGATAGNGIRRFSRPVHGTVVAAIPVDNTPGATSGFVEQIDLASGAVTGRITLGRPVAIAVDPVRPCIYVTDRETSIVTVDTTAFAVARTDAVPGVLGAVISPAGDRLFVVVETGGAISVEAWDASSHARLAAIPMPSLDTLTADLPIFGVSQSGATLFVGTAGALLAFDAANLGASPTTIALPGQFSPAQVTVTRDGRTCLVAGYDAATSRGVLHAIDTLSFALVSSVSTAEGYWSIAPGVAGSDAVFACMQREPFIQTVNGATVITSSGLTAIDLASRTLLAPVPVDTASTPRLIALSPGGDTIMATTDFLVPPRYGKLTFYDASTLGAIGDVEIPWEAAGIAWLR
jgi:DNA-binding beta-propeller fold protein YncE